MSAKTGYDKVVLTVHYRSLLEATEHVAKQHLADPELTKTYKEDVRKMLDAIDTVKSYQP